RPRTGWDGSMSDSVVVGGLSLSREQVLAVVRGGAAVEISPEARAAVAATRAHVDALAAAETPTYGVSTGFGALAVRHIPPDRRIALQRSFVRSHAAGA